LTSPVPAADGGGKDGVPFQSLVFIFPVNSLNG
jgi:hypothetical protein